MKLNVDDLIAKKLVSVKTSPCGKYRLLKYTKKVFYDNLWHLDARLLECRGTVVDAEDNIIMYPFTKVFNYSENGTGLQISDDTEVIAVRKVNGYLAQAQRYFDGVDFKLRVTSSGSFTGEFAEIAQTMIEEALSGANRKVLMSENFTYLFEVCHAGDPHIVDEKPGVYLIGVRDGVSNKMLSENSLDNIAATHNFLRPQWFQTVFGDVKDIIQYVRHEGFMVRDMDGETICKFKSKHYLSKKAMMRVGKAQIEVMFDNPTGFKQRLDEEFYGCYAHIQKIGKDAWKSLDEQGRRAIIEEYFDVNDL